MIPHAQYIGVAVINNQRLSSAAVVLLAAAKRGNVFVALQRRNGLKVIANLVIHIGADQFLNANTGIVIVDKGIAVGGGGQQGRGAGGSNSKGSDGGQQEVLFHTPSVASGLFVRGPKGAQNTQKCLGRFDSCATLGAAYGTLA